MDRGAWSVTVHGVAESGTQAIMHSCTYSCNTSITLNKINSLNINLLCPYLKFQILSSVLHFFINIKICPFNAWFLHKSCDPPASLYCPLFFHWKISHSSKCVVPSHWGFNLNFLDDSDADSNIMSLIQPYMFFGEVSVQNFAYIYIFNGLFSWCWMQVLF